MNNKPQRLREEKFVIRLPGGMRSRIAETARFNIRSMNSEIVHRLERTAELESALERAHRIIDQLLTGPSPVSQSGAET